MSHLVVAGRPTNLHPGFGVRVNQVEADVWMVCDRIKEKFGDRLYVVVLDDNTRFKFTVVERCDDGQDRMVKSYEELTPKILHDLDFMLSIDPKQRAQILERENDAWREQWEQEELDRQYENVGRPMLSMLEKTGFLQRPVSYPKTGVTGGKGSLKKSRR